MDDISKNYFINIGTIEQEGLTFTSISIVPYLNDYHISLAFSFERYKKMDDNPHVI
jgi:hypothetical protein